MKSLLSRTRDQDERPSNCPDWMLTYGDLMGQLLCFFIILVSMSTIRDEKFRKLMDSIRQAFGYDLGQEVTPGASPGTSSVWDHLPVVQAPRGHENLEGGAEVVNVNGREFLCKTVREGRLITVGDRTTFAAGAAEIPASMREDLDALIALMKDYPNRLLIQGHVSPRETSGAEGEWDLSFRRAQAVGDYFERQGIHPRRLRLSACGGVDPMDTNLSSEGQARNRRVEIVVSEELILDVVPRRPDHE